MNSTDDSTAGWRIRLRDAIKASGMSDRDVSLSAGFGAGYIHSILGEGKDPTVGKLMGVCEVIGASPTFILYGIDVSQEDADVIAAMRESPDMRDAVLTLLRNRRPT